MGFHSEKKQKKWLSNKNFLLDRQPQLFNYLFGEKVHPTLITVGFLFSFVSLARPRKLAVVLQIPRFYFSLRIYRTNG